MAPMPVAAGCVCSCDSRGAISGKVDCARCGCTSAIELADNRLVGIWWTGEHHQAHEVAVAEEGEEIGTDACIGSCRSGEGGLVDLEEGRSKRDHVAAVGVERAVCCGAQLILVNAKSIGVGLTWTDCSRGSEEAV